MTDDLVTWLRAQLDDDDRVAQECIAEVGPERVGDRFTDDSGTAEQDAFPHYPYGSQARELAFMAGPGHPARVLAEVDAKRRILDEIVPEADMADQTVDKEYATEPRDLAREPWLGDRLLRLLALPYAGRPGYLEEWAPDDS